MTMSVSYTIFNGQIVKENRGGTERFYAPDTLGSTAQLLDSTGTVTDTYTYWPYGEIRSHIGTSTTPLTFVGTLGYYLDLVANWFYVRARYYQQSVGRLLTADPLWPQEPAYCYGKNEPTLTVDPSGYDTDQELSFSGFIGFCYKKTKGAVGSVWRKMKGIVPRLKSDYEEVHDFLTAKQKSIKCPDTPSCTKMCTDWVSGTLAISWPCFDCCGDICGVSRDCMNACYAICDGNLARDQSYLMPPCLCKGSGALGKLMGR